MITVTDALGRDASQLAICARCGQMVGTWYTFRGQTYGSDCIEVVTGQRKDRYVWNGNAIDEKATARRDAEHQERVERQRRLDAEHAAKLISDTERFTRENADIIEILKGSWGNFAADMAITLSRCSLADLSQRQFDIVADIYSKAFGRGNSKAYWAAHERLEVMRDR